MAHALRSGSARPTGLILIFTILILQNVANLAESLNIYRCGRQALVMFDDHFAASTVSNVHHGIRVA